LKASLYLLMYTLSMSTDLLAYYFSVNIIQDESQ
jgi:hypothetical protein